MRNTSKIKQTDSNHESKWMKQHLHFDLGWLPVRSQLLYKTQRTGSVVALVNCHIYFGHSGSLVGYVNVVCHGGVFNSCSIFKTLICGVLYAAAKCAIYENMGTNACYIILESSVCGNASQKDPTHPKKKFLPMHSGCRMTHRKRLLDYSLIPSEDVTYIEQRGPTFQISPSVLTKPVACGV